MKFTLSWLKEHLETSAELNLITETLTNIGLEIESIEDKTETYKNFTVARVIKADKHPDADKLKVCEVETVLGNFKVVCGAPNAHTGMLGIFAPENSYIPGTGLHLKKSKIRGVESCGMLVSEREMGISDEHEGIIEVDKKHKIGEKFIEIFNLDDPIIEINITPNRSDCLSVRGIARDLAAAGLGKLKNLEFKKIKDTFKSPISWKKNFKNDSEYFCPGVSGRYFKNVKNGESPIWLQQRLKAIGLRPISKLVDITNYITYDLGRPLHVYDADKLSGDLTMRFAKQGEKCLTLDEINYECTDEMIVIADNKELHGIGGVMGGLKSGCDLKTKNVFLEVALFDPISVTKTGRKLNLQTDARYRFERGIDSESIYWGVEAASRMITELCGGECSEIVSTKIINKPIKKIEFNSEKITTFGGINIPIKNQITILESLGFNTKAKEKKLEITVPTHRPDIVGEADIVEEIMRIHGFDNIPVNSVDKSDKKNEVLNSNLKPYYKVRRFVAIQGYTEVVTWSFMDEVKANKISKDLINIENPISNDLSVMRPSNFPNLLQSINQNKARMYFSGKIFEVGPIFLKSLENNQQNIATAISYGTKDENNWLSSKKDINVFDIKGDLLLVLNQLNIPIENLIYENIANNIFHPGKSSSLKIGKNIIANFGELHPILLKTMDVENPVFGFEIYLDNISQFQNKKIQTKSSFDNNPYQMVERDFAFLFNKEIRSNDIVKKIKKIDKNIINKVTVFDVYEGDKLPINKKSIALRVLLQPQDKTFTDEEIEDISKKIINLVTIDFEATLRQ
tara:strand:+ start:12345 stop:14738 length:2394 start_codon:yes stop_codon:yes gene_type:complete